MVDALPGLRDLSPPWLDRLAGLWPGRIAVVDTDNSIRYTYSDLQERANRVAGRLVALGVGPGDRVAAVMHNGVPLLDLLFACGRLGAILAPLNWRLSRAELSALLEDLAPTVSVYDPEFVPGTGGDHISSDALLDEASDLPSAPLPPPAARLSDAWIILYTGGTTGLPKGAILTHGSVTWNAVNTAMSWGLSERDTGPNFTPMFHTGGLNVFTLPLLFLGGRVLLPQRFDAADALRILQDERPTVLFMVPTMFGLVAEQPEFAGADLSSLRWAISGGAPLPESTTALWRSKVRIFKQGYGLTEVGPNNFATPDERALAAGAGSVGRITLFARARIVDDAGEDLPDRSPGELLLAGPHMSAGYWRRPEATAEAYRDGWFHTGDVAVRDEEGYYWIVDRKKDMIITGGENVYPVEVERALYSHPAVREAAVVGIPDPTWGEAVTGVISLKSGMEVSQDDLRRYLREQLAAYKVPKRIVVVPELPKSAAGKILRKEARKLVPGP